MNDYRDLMNAVRTSGADESPKLIFTDWLEEHGQWERAAAIRRHIVIGKMSRKPSSIPVGMVRSLLCASGLAPIQFENDRDKWAQTGRKKRDLFGKWGVGMVRVESVLGHEWFTFNGNRQTPRFRAYLWDGFIQSVEMNVWQAKIFLPTMLVDHPIGVCNVFNSVPVKNYTVGGPDGMYVLEALDESNWHGANTDFEMVVRNSHHVPVEIWNKLHQHKMVNGLGQKFYLTAVDALGDLVNAAMLYALEELDKRG